MRQRKVAPALATLIILVSVTYSATLADRGFKELVSSLEARFGSQQTEAPMNWLGAALAKLGKSDVSGDFNIAVFNHVGLEDGGEQEFEEAVRSSLGTEWKPVARIRSRRDRENTAVYVSHSDGKVRVIVSVLAAGRATIIQARFEPKDLAAALREHPEEILSAGDR
jgi:hypothetical protein